MLNFDFIFLVSHAKEVPTCFKQIKIPIITIESLLANDFRKLTSNTSFFCLITGIGFNNSERSLQWIKHNINVSLLINIGSCGSNNPFYLNTLVCPQEFKFDSSLYYGLGIFPFFTNETIHLVNSCETVLQPNTNIISEFVDMESFWQAKFCHENNIFFTSLKYVTDQNNRSTSKMYTANLTKLQEQFNLLFNNIFQKVSPSISVIIPTFNRAPFLKRSIDSVLNQTLKAECIVVDDGSNDDTASILKSYKNQITILSLEKNSGVSIARNKGILHSRSKWISFLDSDDEWAANKLENQLLFHNTYPYYSVLQSQEHWIRNGNHVNKKKYHTKQYGYIWDHALKRCAISASSVLIERSLFDTIGLFDENLKSCEDYDLWLRISRHYLVGLDNNFSLTKFAGHDDQLSFKYQAMDRFRLYSLKKVFKTERNPIFKSKLIDMINIKETILKKGQLKRKDTSIYDKENLL